MQSETRNRLSCLALLGMIFSVAAFGQAFNVRDCNDPEVHHAACAHPTQALIDAARAAGYRYYVGHAEPTVKFFSNAGASGNNMQWKFKLPATDPAPNQTGTSVANFELDIAHWISISLCDPNSYPYGPCTPNSDTNTSASAGSAFLELQFFPPGFSGSNTQWSVLLHINTFQNNNATQINNCLEPTTAQFVTPNGVTEPNGGTRIFLNNGDTIVVTLHDTATGLRADVNDVTTSNTGFMVASGANGFKHNSNLTDCTTSAFDFHPEYATAAPGNFTGWTSLNANVAFDFEIGHWELCSDATCTTLPDPPESTAANCGTRRGIGGCTDSDLDHDGTSYLADWPDGTAAHPAPIIIISPNDKGVGPLSAATSTGTTYTQGYKTIAFKTTEGTNGAFYPFYSQAGTGAACAFNFGNDIPGTTTNDFGKKAQYGTSITNPCFPAAALAPTISKAFIPEQIPLNSTSALTFSISNTDGSTTLTGVGFTDLLPAGLVVVSASGGCGGGTITAVSGANSVGLAGATLAPLASCTFSVTVRGVTPGIKTNSTSTIISDESADGAPAVASLSVVAPPVISKTFVPNKVIPGGTTTLSFSITNPNSFAVLTGVALTDNLPSGVVVATPNSLSNTCGGAATATAGAGTVNLTGGTIAASGTCSVSLKVSGVAEGVKLNSAQVSSTNGGTGNTASATLFVATPPNLTKAFGEVSIGSLSSTTLTFTLTNPNHIVTLTGLLFSDTLPAGLVVSTPNQLTGSCDGGTITAAGNLITLGSATLAPQAACTFSLSVTSDGTEVGYVTNTTSTVTSVEALPGAAASARLFVGDPLQISYVANLTAGDSYIDITNAGTLGTGPESGTPASITGAICVNVYAFSPDEQMIACCSCPVTPNGLVSLSAKSDLTSNTLTPAIPTAIVIKTLATVPVGGSCDKSAAAVQTATLANGIVAWGSSLHAAPVPGMYAVTEKRFSAATLNATELTRLGQLCNFIQANGSGYGVCRSCRVGGLGADRQ